MSEKEHEEEENPSEGTKSTSYLIRCTQSQKELLQSLAYASGQNVADFLVMAARQSSPKTKVDTQLEKDLREMDELIERLTKMAKAKLIVAHEVIKRSEEEQQALIAEQARVEEALTQKVQEVEEEVQQRRQTLEEEFSQKELEWEKTLKESDKAWEKKWLELKETTERLESDLDQKNKEARVRERQYADSVRLHETIEQRNFDLKAQNDELKKKLMDLEKYKEIAERDKHTHEKQVVDLNHQLDLQRTKQEEALKHMEKEFEFKAKLLEFEIEKRFLSQINHGAGKI